jgi:hypothetical protein
MNDGNNCNLNLGGQFDILYFRNVLKLLVVIDCNSVEIESLFSVEIHGPIHVKVLDTCVFEEMLPYFVTCLSDIAVNFLDLASCIDPDNLIIFITLSLQTAARQELDTILDRSQA